MKLKCGIFDMDGTLIDSMPMWRRLGLSILLTRGLEPDEEFSEAMKPLTMRQGCAYCKERYHLSESVEEIAEGCWLEVKRFYQEEVRPFPGLTAFLEKLKGEGVKLLIATATDRTYAEIALRATGLADYFEGMLTCTEVGTRKDVPDIYEQALALSGCAKEDAVVFEDALYAIRTAKEAGFRVAAIHDPAIPDDHAEIRDLADYYIETYETL